jgi:hypothetical protein
MGLRGLGLLVAAVFGLLTSGCAVVQGFPERSLDLKAERAVLGDYLKPQVITNYLSPSDTARGGLSRRAYRDLVIEARIRDADLRFAAFERSLYSDGIGFGIGTDWMALAANAYGALSNNSAQSMAVMATAVTGAKGAVDKNAFYDKALPVLMAQMVAQRKAALVALRTGQNQPDSQYSLMRALGDLEDYERAGSIPGALNAISANAGADDLAATEELKTILTPGPVEPTLQARRRSAAAWAKALSPADQQRLAATLPSPKDPTPVVAILDAIEQARTPADFDRLSQKIAILYGRTF